MLITPHVIHDQRDARALTEDLRSQLLMPGSSRSSCNGKASRAWLIQTGCKQLSRRLSSFPAFYRRQGGFALILVLWTLVLIGSSSRI